MLAATHPGQSQSCDPTGCTVRPDPLRYHGSDVLRLSQSVTTLSSLPLEFYDTSILRANGPNVVDGGIVRFFNTSTLEALSANTVSGGTTHTSGLAA